MNKIKEWISKLINFLFDETSLSLNLFFIGNELFMVLENSNHERFIYNKVLIKLIELEIPFLYFHSYFEFESNFEYLNLEEKCFLILIG